MIEKKKIDSLQNGILIWFLAKAGLLGILFNQLNELVFQDIWISTLIGILLGLIPLSIYLFIANYDYKLNIIELNKKIFGKVLGSILNILIIVLVFFMGQIIFLNLIKFIETNLLVVTPTVVVGTLFLIPIGLLAVRGIEVITRSGVALFTGATILFLTAIAGLTSYIELENIMPILEHSSTSIMKGALLYVSITTAPLLMFLIIKKNQIVDKNNYNRSILLWYFSVSIVIFIIIFWTSSILSSKLADIYNFPVYTVVKKISVVKFLERFENLIIWTLIIDIVFFISLSIHFILEAIKSSFTIKNAKWDNIIVIALSILLLITPVYIISNYVALEIWLYNYYGPIIGVATFSIITMIFLRLLFEKKQT
jgi:spore germination protein KB